MTDLKQLLLKKHVTGIDDVRVSGHSGALFAPVGIMLHHTGSDGPALNTCVHGRPDLQGPLCHINISRDGIIHLVTDGIAWHAGPGSEQVLRQTTNGIAPSGTAKSRGLKDDSKLGNLRFYGIEVDNNGRGEVYSRTLIHRLTVVCAGLCSHHGWTANHAIHHKEWTERKIDMSYTGPIRHEIAETMKEPRFR
jgi:hypothetical protein